MFLGLLLSKTLFTVCWTRLVLNGWIGQQQRWRTVSFLEVFFRTNLAVHVCKVMMCVDAYSGPPLLTTTLAHRFFLEVSLSII